MPNNFGATTMDLLLTGLYTCNPTITSAMGMFQQLTSRTNYSEVIPILFSHVSTNGGHPVIGIFVRRMPNPWPP